MAAAPPSVAPMHAETEQGERPISSLLLLDEAEQGLNLRHVRLGAILVVGAQVGHGRVQQLIENALGQHVDRLALLVG